mmetsp:Transcript_107041/g.313027  ORF Transcript_107041/g.313027 Transcript_107041/m.313027 type:complete len:125 (-) Transcript_107041:1071-1445(-)
MSHEHESYSNAGAAAPPSHAPPLLVSSIHSLPELLDHAWMLSLLMHANPVARVRLLQLRVLDPSPLVLASSQAGAFGTSASEAICGSVSGPPPVGFPPRDPLFRQNPSGSLPLCIARAAWQIFA